MNAMMRHNIVSKVFATVLLIAVISAGILFAVGKNKEDDAAGKLAVTASYYPLYDFVSQVGGDKVQVTTIVPAGIEPHDFDPSPKALASARQSDIFIYNSVFEPWAAKFVDDYTHAAVDTSRGIVKAFETDIEHNEVHADNDRMDPHFWLDPVLAQRIIIKIKDSLIRADPENKGYYTQRADTYTAKLQELDRQFRQGLSQCAKDTIVASHDAFSYVARRYGFSVQSIAGLSPEAEPSPARLAELSDYVRSNHITYIFFEELVSPRLADTIAQETGARTSVLNPIEGLTHEDQKKGRDYLSIQRENLSSLRTALACH